MLKTLLRRKIIMNHQPFETWILTEEPLTPEQAQALHEHLDECDACTRLSAAWNSVGRLLQTTPAAKPAAGFRVRWQARLEREQQLAKRKLDRRQSWILLSIYSGGALVILLLIVLQALLIFDSPADLLLAGVYRFSAAYTNLNVIEELLTTLVTVLITTIPPVYWMAFAAVLGMLSLTWIFSLQRLILPRRITK